MPLTAHLALIAAFIAAIAAPCSAGPAWTVISGPYRATHLGQRCLIIRLARSDGATADVYRFAGSGPVEQTGGTQWQALTFDGAEGRWSPLPWGGQARVRFRDATWLMTIRAAKPATAEDVLAALSAARTAADAMLRRSEVAAVRARPVGELPDELWVPALVALTQAAPAPPWVRPGGLIRRIVVGADSGRDGPTVLCQRLSAGVRRVSFAADIGAARRRTVIVTWYLDDRPVRSSRTVARPGGRIVGWLTASHGLPAGRYRVEIRSAAGLEASAELILVPSPAGQ